MFEFLSKLVSRRTKGANAAQIPVAIKPQPLTNEVRQKATEQARQQYLQKISASMNNEANLLALMSACDFADGRYEAARHIHTPELMEKALQIARKSDKRVAKLMQQRLDQIQQQHALQAQAQACVERAEACLQSPVILANQLVELDRQFATVKTVPSELQAAFAEKRAELQARLDAQLDLQRQVLQLTQDIERVQNLSEIDGDTVLETWKLALQAYAASPYVVSLPKNLLTDTQAKFAQAESNWHRQQSQSASVAPEQNQLTESLEVVASERTTAAQQDQSVLSTMAQEEPPKLVVQLDSEPKFSIRQIEDFVTQFEAALEQGSLQAARQIEKELREIDTKRTYQQFRLSDNLKERLNAARKELSRLLSWAKWSGAVSRDELIETAEKLGSLRLSPQEIVDTVSALREQWKQIESQGGASKELWLRFDTACKLVYAPAAAHFQSQSELRKENQQKAEALLVQFAVEAEEILNHLSDWKMLRSKIIEMQNAWKKIGHVDRKERARLDREFDALIVQLKEPLEQRQQEEIQAREKMIAEVEALDALQKSSQDQLRSLQHRWQMQASTVPLQRRDEQQLWERFRTACDGVFEKKRQLAETADQQREANLAAKRAICLELANTDLLDRQQLSKAIETASTNWRQIGHVPRTQEHAIEKEFQQRIQDLQQALAKLALQESQLRAQKIYSALSICQRLDDAIEKGGDLAELIKRESDAWDALNFSELSTNSIAKVLISRFEKAIKLSPESQMHFQQTLQNNSLQFDDVCLHLEILLGIESNAVSSQERLKKQVEVLQSAMRSNDNQSRQNLLKQLCSLPVSPTDQRVQRLQNLMSTVDLSQ